MHLLLTRPDTGEVDPLEAALVAAGHRVLGAPLLTVVATGYRPALEGVQGLIATSRNGLRAVANDLTEAARSLPLYAVGPGTAALAGTLGFRDVIEGPGTGRALAETIRRKAKPDAGRLIHLAGETLAFDLKAALAPKGFEVSTEPVYRSEPADRLPASAIAALRGGTLDGVILMSPRTAMVYVSLMTGAALAPAAGKLRHFCLSEAVARALSPLGDVPLRVAQAPNAQEMLALIAREAPDSG